MVLVPFLQFFGVLGQICCPPSCRVQMTVCLVCWAAAHQSATFVLGPISLYLFPLLLPCLGVAIDHPTDVGCVAAVAPHQLKERLLVQALQFCQGRKLMIALHKGLQVDVKSTAFLTFDGPMNGINPAKNAARGSGVAPENVSARGARSCAVRALAAIANSKQMPQSQQDQCLETLCTSKRVSC